MSPGDGPGPDAADADRALGLGSILLGVGLAANSVVGPLAAGAIRYRFSETLVAQGVGLDAVSLLVVAPLSVWAGVRALRRHPHAAVLALPPAVYAAYMSVQYAIGPEYLGLPGNNERFFPLHLGLFILALAVAARAWTAVDPRALPPRTLRGRRWLSALLLALGGLLLLRYLPALADLVGGGPTLPEYRANPTSFLLIAWLDLGIFMPAALGAGVALRRGAGWARKALFAIVGWFALVGLAVGAMTVAMRVRDDPAASTGGMVGFLGAGVALAALALWLYASLGESSPESDHGGAG